jgi:hypothetical protein
MKFVNSAISEVDQNMSVIQQGRDIYYEASKNIYKDTELMVWYGRNYELFMGIPLALRKEGKEPISTLDRKLDIVFKSACKCVFVVKIFSRNKSHLHRKVIIIAIFI